MAKTPTADDPTTPPADPFAWDPDPTVLVSRRSRRFYVPRVLFERDATEAERATWKSRDSLASQRGDSHVVAQAGLTFLGTLMTSWRDWTAHSSAQVSQVPDMSRAVLLQPISQAQETIRGDMRHKDRATGRLIPSHVRAIFERVFGYVQEVHADLWRPMDHDDAPEMLILPLSEVFSQRTDRGQQANAIITAAIPVLRRVQHETVTPVCALHDYAIRARGGGAAAILAACKAKGAKWKIGAMA
jgi:hypothetical protein